MTTDCSLNYEFNTWKFQAQNMGRTCCVKKLFLTFRTIYVHNMFSPCSAKIRASDKDLPVQCPICKKDYSGQVALKNHIILKHERSAQHQCEICQGKYPTATKLRHHINMVHSKVE